MEWQHKAKNMLFCYNVYNPLPDGKRCAFQWDRRFYRVSAAGEWSTWLFSMGVSGPVNGEAFPLEGWGVFWKVASTATWFPGWRGYHQLGGVIRSGLPSAPPIGGIWPVNNKAWQLNLKPRSSDALTLKPIFMSSLDLHLWPFLSCFMAQTLHKIHIAIMRATPPAHLTIYLIVILMFGAHYKLMYFCCILSFGWFPGIRFRCRGFTQKKKYNIQYKVKVWNQE